jgi:hypothetical protein
VSGRLRGSENDNQAKSVCLREKETLRGCQAFSVFAPLKSLCIEKGTHGTGAVPGFDPLERSLLWITPSFQVFLFQTIQQPELVSR